MRDMAHQSCEVNIDGSLDVPEPDVMSASADADSVTCNGGSDGVITISSITGGSGEYEFTKDGGANWQTSPVFTGLIPDTYMVWIRDKNHPACEVSLDDALVITEPGVLNATVTADSVTCNGESDGIIIFSSVTGGSLEYEYSINGGTDWQTDSSFNGLPAGTYDARIRDKNDTACEVTPNGALILSEPAVLSGVAVADSVTCNGGSDGTITFGTESGGSGEYEYSINGGAAWQSSPVFTGLAAGTYDAWIRDKNYTTCLVMIDGTLDISEPAALSISNDSTTDEFCEGLSDGTVTVEATGGTAPYTFTISPGDSTNNIGTFINLPAGTYTVNVEDDHGCGPLTSSVLTIALASYDLAFDNIVVSDVTCFGNNDGTINITVSGGTGPYNYLWSNDSTSEDISDLVSGDYSVTVTDDLGCYIDSVINVAQPPVITVSSVDSTDITCFGASDGSITITAGGGTGTLEYSIDSSDTYIASGGVFTDLASGTYYPFVRDANLCMVDAGTATINEPSAIIVTSVDSTDVTCNGASDGTITIVAGGGTGALEYSIDSSDTYIANGGVFTDLASGTYYLFVRDAGLCMVDAGTATINEPTTVVATSIDSTDVTCNGASDGTITIVAGGGTGALEYSIDSSDTYIANGGVFTGLASGTYYLFVRDANLCMVDAGTATINEPAAIVVTSVDSVDITCNGASDGTITIVAGGGTGALEYSIDSSDTYIANGGVFTGLASGTYYPFVRDANLCMVDAGTATINEPSAIIVTSIDSTDVTCNGSSDGTITIVAGGGTGALEYSIDSSDTFVANGGVFTGLASGTYYLFVRDAGLCMVDAGTATINEPAAIVVTSVDSVDVTCNGASDGTITIVASGGNGALQYSIDSTDTFVSNGGVFTGLASDTYYLFVRDAGLCVVNAGTATINEPTTVVVTSIDSTDVTCNGASDGTITIVVGGGTGALEYSIDSSDTYIANGGVFTGLASGTFYLFVRDAGLCTVNAGTATINEPTTVVVTSIDSTDVTCNGASDGTITIVAGGGTGALEYSIDSSDTFIANGGVFTGLASGTYYLFVRDANLCMVDAGTATINEPAAIVITSIDSTDVTCNGASDGEISIIASGGTGILEFSCDSGYTWNPGGCAGLSGGIYYLFIRDENLCIVDAGAVTINEPAAIVVSSVDSTDVTCNGASDGTITIVAGGGTGALEYSIDSSDTYIANGGVFTGLASGTYYLFVRDAGLCMVDAGTATINEPTTVVVTSVDSTDVTCNGASDGTITIVAGGGTGALQYSIDSAVTFAANGGAFTGLATGTYYLFVRDANLCTVNAGTATVNEPAAIIITSVDSADVTCNGASNGTITIVAGGGTGALEYSVDSAATFITNGGVFIGLASATYYLFVRDANLCIVNTGTATVNEPAAIIITSVDSADVTCNGACDGAISVTASGGTGPLQFSCDSMQTWNPGPCTGLCAGTYYLFVRDANLCEVNIGPVTINEPAAVAVSSVTPEDVTCNGADDGTITIVAGGGTGTLEYSIDSAVTFIANGGIFTDLSPGTYYLFVRDANLCMVSAGTDTIIEPAVIVVNLVDSTDVTCNGADDGTITILASGGTGTLEYSIDSANTFVANGGVFTNLAPGAYYLFVRDANLCMFSAGTATINEPAAIIIISVDSTDVTCNGACDGTISIVAAGGTGGLQFSCDSMQTWNSGSCTGLCAGTYYLFVRDENLCEFNIGPVTISEPPAIIVTSVDSMDATCNGTNDGTITIVASGGTGTLEYSLDSANTFVANGGLFTDLTPGTYYLFVMDEGLCTVNAGTATINEPEVFDDTLAVTQNTCFGAAAGAINATVSGGTAPYEYSWTGPYDYASGEENIDSLYEGVYHLVVTDANNCTVEDSAILTDPQALYAERSTDSVSCNGGSDGSILIRNVSGGSGCREFSIGDGIWQADSTFTGLPAGTYDAMVRDCADTTCVLTFDFLLIISQPDTLLISQEDATDVLCSGRSDGTVTVTADGGTPPYLYTISPGDSTNSTGLFINLPAGTYTVSVTDAHSCGPVNSSALVVGVASSDLSIIAVAADSVNCIDGNDGSIDITVGGGIPPYTYLWSNGETTEDISNLTVDTFTVTVTDDAGCQIDSSIILGEPDELVLQVETVTNPACFADSDGSVTVSVVGGTQPYNFNWTGPDSYTSTDEDITGLSAGTYRLTVTDAQGCSDTVSAPLTEPEQLHIDNVDLTNIACNGENDGTIIVDASGGTSPLNYRLIPGDGIQRSRGEFDNLGPGKYVIEINDTNFCGPVESDTIEITEPDPITIDSLVITPAVEGESNGSIYFKVSGGTPPYTVTIDGGIEPDTDTTFTELPAGEYTLMITDDNGCTLDSTIIVPSTPANHVFIKAFEAITPNGDGKNDKWYIVVYRDEYALENDLWEPVNAVFPDCVVKIYTPTGNLVFSTKKYDNQWDGTINGKKVDPGTYYYVINPGRGKDPVSGSLTIIY
jgi:gliding motility-associated-like protein